MKVTPEDIRLMYREEMILDLVKTELNDVENDDQISNDLFTDELTKNCIPENDFDAIE